MLRFTGITMRNFQTIGNATQAVRLDRAPLTLILGMNLDVMDDEARNGVGKTTIAQALSFVLYNSAITELSRLDSLVNRDNERDMLCSVEFERGTDSYRIERGRKPVVLNVFKNGQAQNDAQGKNSFTQEDIEQLIGMNHKLFEQIVIMHTYSAPFLSMKPPQQREIIEELFSIKVLSERDETLMTLVRKSKAAITDEAAKIKANVEANTRIEAALATAETARKEWIEARTLRIAEIEETLEAMGSIDLVHEAQLFDDLVTWRQAHQTALHAIETNTQRIGLLHQERTALERDLASHGRAVEQEASNLAASEAQALAASAAIEGAGEEIVLYARQNLERVRKSIAAQHESRLEALSSKIETLLADQAREAEALDVTIVQLAEAEKDLANATAHCPECGQTVDDPKHLRAVHQRGQARVAQLEAAVSRARATLSRTEAAIDTASDQLAPMLDGPSDDDLKPVSAAEEELKDAEAKLTTRKAEAVMRAEYAANAVEAGRDRLKVVERDAAAAIALINNRLSAMVTPLEDAREALLAAQAATKELGPEPAVNFASREEIWEMRDRMHSLQRDLQREWTEVNPHDAHVASIRATIVVIDRAPLEALETQLRHEEFLHKLLSGKDSFVRKRIIDRNLLALNTALREYLEAHHLKYEVRFCPDLTVEITLHGKDYEFALLSKGERARVVIGVSLAFRDVWEMLNHGINLSFVDELIDSGTDDAGAKAALGVLKKIADKQGKNILLVSHKAGLLGRVDRKLNVILENNFTRFEEADN